ncbi:MAG TPA: LuxR C-terminal-related transcriptional regulator [Candidatus Dormibacteraeota bacterium]|nr:LuxR C-terminal-related transcriptional regulator [Candidatus Dormibacteraeota bacterium]
MTDELKRGRDSFDQLVWADAYAFLAAADRVGPLAAEDLDRLAMAALLMGKEEESADLLQRAHNAHLRLGDEEGAARCAIKLAMSLTNSGEFAQAGGWLARANRILDDGQRDCVEVGYLLVPAAIESFRAGELDSARAAFQRVTEVAARFEDHDLLAMGRLGLGRSQIALGNVAGGVSLLDEIMVAVTSGEITPFVSGVIYCAVIQTCYQIFDLRRAQEWTAALNRWCEAQPGLVAFRGECLVYRAEILQTRGLWPDAMNEAIKAQELLSRPPAKPAVGGAHYQLGELSRLGGDFSKAEDAYRRASAAGRSPQPGLALMRMAEGKVDAAVSAIRRELEEARDRSRRASLLPAYVEIMIAANDLEAARAAASELSELARVLSAPYLAAVDARAKGALLLAEGDQRGALDSLRRALAAWREIDAPYECARVHVLIGLACRQLGDQDAAEMEFDAARRTFEQLGAGPDLASVGRLSPPPVAKASGGLSEREVQVLRLIATGRSNRAIASHLVISEKTVARHVSNIFTKLGLSTRAAATAYAYEHGLNPGTT